MGVRLRELRDDELPDWLEAARRFYVDDLERHAGMTRAEAEDKAKRDHDALFPDGRALEGHHLFAIEDEHGEGIGRLWFAERASGLWLYEIDLEERVRGRGLGRQTMLVLEGPRTGARGREGHAQRLRRQRHRPLPLSLARIRRGVGAHGKAALGLRVLERLDALYAIGGGPGANRPHGVLRRTRRTRSRLGGCARPGSRSVVDAAGNLVGRAGERPDVWVGSHLDTVPRGGRFDGALGVVAAIEAVESAGVGSVVAFRGEEVGCIGSRALCSGGAALPSAFLELHVEQGPVLAAADAPLGVVTSIVGYARGELVFEGAAGHAGTTPMDRARRRARRGGRGRAADPRRRPRDRGSGRHRRRAHGRAGSEQRHPLARAALRGRARARLGASRAPRLRDRVRTRPAHRARADGRGAPACPAGGDRGPRPPRGRASVGRRARRRDSRGGRCPERDALRPQPERRSQPLARRALLRRGRRARGRGPTAALRRLARST